MRMMRLLSFMMLFFLAACSSGLKLVKAGVDLNRGPYVDGKHGVENLAFDGEGVLFAAKASGEPLFQDSMKSKHFRSSGRQPMRRAIQFTPLPWWSFTPHT